MCLKSNFLLRVSVSVLAGFKRIVWVGENFAPSEARKLLRLLPVFFYRCVRFGFDKGGPPYGLSNGGGKCVLCGKCDLPQMTSSSFAVDFFTYLEGKCVLCGKKIFKFFFCRGDPLHPPFGFFFLFCRGRPLHPPFWTPFWSYFSTSLAGGDPLHPPILLQFVVFFAGEPPAPPFLQIW